MHVDLEYVLQNEVSRDLRLVWVLVVKYETIHVILALPLQRPVMEADVLHGVSPNRLRNVVRKSKVSRDKHKYSLNPSSYNDPHEEIRDDTCNGHHQALNHSDAGVEVENEEDVVGETWVKAHHEVAYGP